VNGLELWKVTVYAMVVVFLFVGAGASSPDQAFSLRIAAFTLLAPFIVEFVQFLANRKNTARILARSVFLRKREYVRFSMSYQFRIFIDGKYLLVRNQNPNFDWYQFPGGKYKRFESAGGEFDQHGVLTDNRLPTSAEKHLDLAVLVPARQTCWFMRWFESKRDREVSHFREFREELLSGEAPILPGTLFPYVNYRFATTVMTPLKRAPAESGWNCHEVLRYDVLDLVPTQEQVEVLRETMKHEEYSQYVWVSPERIESLGYDPADRLRRFRVGIHAKWVLRGHWTRE
jgi:hypothetical protein